MRTIENYNAETGESTFIIITYGQKFTGTAKCHELDADMKNKNTGLTIAEYRAQIAYYRYMRDSFVGPGHKALNDFYKNISNAKDFDPKSYIARKLRREIHDYANDLNVLKSEIRAMKEELKAFLDSKELFYSKVRKNRKETE